MVAESVEKQDAFLSPLEVRGLPKITDAPLNKQLPEPVILVSPLPQKQLQSSPPSQPQQAPAAQGSAAPASASASASASAPAPAPAPTSNAIVPKEAPASNAIVPKESDPNKALPPPWVLGFLYRKDVQAVENVIKISDGRDKVCKLVQYGGRLLVWYLLRFESFAKNPAMKGRLDLLESVCGNVSKIRKVLRICKWGYEMPNCRKHIRDFSSKKTPFEQVYGGLRVLNSFLGMGTDFIDDLNLYTSWGLLPKLVQTTLEPVGPKFWLANVLFDLSFLSHEIYNMECEAKELDAKLQATDKTDEKACAKLSDEISKLYVKRVAKYIAWTKLFGDLIVALNNALNLNWSKGVVQGGGLLSGICSFYKLYQIAYSALK